MTTIVYRDGIMAADSRVTVDSEAGGSRHFRCEKLYRVETPRGKTRAVIGLAGESFPGLVFLKWFRTGADEPPRQLTDIDSDFTALVLTREGLFEYDRWCEPERVLGSFHAIGSGCKAALGAMHAGSNAIVACRIACKIDPFSAPPVTWMSLRETQK